MALGKYKIGDLIESVDIKNKNNEYHANDVRGMTTSKVFISTKADLTDVKLCAYKMVPHKHFAYVPDTSRRSNKISLAFNTSNKIYLVSSISSVFKTKNEKDILSDYLFMFFNRSEFDRYARFNSWGSAREVFSFNDLADMDIKLPNITIQQKYVNIYNAILVNRRIYENSLKDLSVAIAASIEEFKHTAPRISVGELLKEVDVRNRNGVLTDVQGVNINKEFMPSVANLNKTDLTKYKIVEKNQFVANFMHVMRDKKVPLALYQTDKPCVVSPAYPVFQRRSDAVIAEYILLWLNRPESDRYAWFISDSSIRGGLEMNRFYEIQIPLPSLSQQRAVVKFYNTRYLIQRNITALDDMLKNICPVLIRGAMEEDS
jgi:type I restriction enzyme S subunit